MKNYESLQDTERHAVEFCLDKLRECLDEFRSVTLANDDRAARAAEALATYIIESKE